LPARSIAPRLWLLYLQGSSECGCSQRIVRLCVTISTVVQGNWKHGQFWGLGDFTCDDGRCYSGEWVAGQRHGKVCLTPAQCYLYGKISFVGCLV
jgi:hypothetical protein